MKELIRKILEEEPSKKLKIDELKNRLDLTSSDEIKSFFKRVNEMIDSFELIENKKHEVSLIEHTDYMIGSLDLKEKGFGFVIPEDQTEDDVFIPRTAISDAMNRDRVLVFLTKKRSGFRREGEIRKVIERKYTYVIGTMLFRNGMGFLDCDDKTIKQDIVIKQEHLNHAVKFDKVQCRIINYNFKGKIECKVVNILGNKDDAFVDVLSKIIKYDVDPYFSEEILKEAEKVAVKSEVKPVNRVDLTKEKIITIDGDDSKDFDDAVIVKKLDNGNMLLGVHIADVSHYVTEGSMLDEEAYKRGTSVYLPGMVVPMLPFALSNGMCSLVPNENRYTISCDMEINPKGKVVKYNIYPSVIRSYQRMTYNQINQIFMGDVDLSNQYVDLVEMFYDMRNLAKILKKRREKTGSIHFETDEAYIILNDQGKAVDVKLRERGISEQIIEEFMLKANQIVAEHVFWMNLPFIYRVHEKPKEEKLNKLLRMSNALGIHVKAKNEISHFELQKLMKSVEGTAVEKGINLLTLRSMQKAIYSEQNLGHYGLAFPYYTHFTSPIRRYPDLIVHRLLRTYLFDKDQTESTIEHYYEIMPSIASQSSKTERNAMLLEREVNDMKKAEYISQYINKEFDGVISSITSFGIYVSLPNTVEGLVHITALNDDYYHYDEQLMTLIGERTKKIYHVGDPVRIRVLKANVIDGEVDFKIVHRRKS